MTTNPCLMWPHYIAYLIKLGTQLIRSLRLLWLGQGRGLYKGGGEGTLDGCLSSSRSNSIPHSSTPRCTRNMVVFSDVQSACRSEHTISTTPIPMHRANVGMGSRLAGVKMMEIHRLTRPCAPV